MNDHAPAAYITDDDLLTLVRDTDRPHRDGHRLYDVVLAHYVHTGSARMTRHHEHYTVSAFNKPEARKLATEYAIRLDGIDPADVARVAAATRQGGRER